MTSVAELLREIRERLARAGVPNPNVDAELIVGHVIGESRGRLQALALMGRDISAEDRDRALTLAEERADRVPLQHLTGRAPFRSFELAVGPGVFVPRPETESVAQHAIDALVAAGAAARAIPVGDPRDTNGNGALNSEPSTPIAVDLCTGSGALAIALARDVPGARVWAVEKSVEAHAWAERNVAELGEGRVELLLGDVHDLDPAMRNAEVPWTAPAVEAVNYTSNGTNIDAGDDTCDNAKARASGRSAATIAEVFAPLRGRVDVLVSNPPYVPDDMVPRDPEVRDHDPALALYGGSDGLDLVRVISRIGLDLVAPEGVIVLEHAETQGAAIRSLLAADGWRDADTHLDLTGRDRVTIALR